MSCSAVHPTFRNAAGYLCLEPAGYVRLVWCQTTSSQPVRALLNEGLHLLETSSCGRMLLDHRRTTLYREEDRLWLLTDWFPRCMRQTNYGYGALLASYDLFVRLAVSSFGQQVRQQYGVHYHYFEAEQEADAIDWLVAQPATLPAR